MTNDSAEGDWTTHGRMDSQSILSVDWAHPKMRLFDTPSSIVRVGTGQPSYHCLFMLGLFLASHLLPMARLKQI